MSDHKWKKDADGAESCEREGCTVRHNPMAGTWQKKKGGHWRHYAPRFGKPDPLPPCAGKEASAEQSPSPLEVVRAAFAYAPDGMQSAALSAIATLEESIRKDEREKCARVAVDIADSWRMAYPEADDAATKEVVEWAESASMDVAHSIRAHSK